MDKYSEEYMDLDYYSRQIGTYGLDTMQKLFKMKILIVGMRGLGVETAKNLILSGPERVDIYDPTTVQIRDLSGNFYLNESHIDQVSRADACIGKLRDLNYNVKVEVMSEELSSDSGCNYDIVVFTEIFHSTEELFTINEHLRSHSKGFILSQTLGLYVYTFVDFGDEFIIYDENGEDTKSFIVTNITDEEEPTVTIQDTEPHGFDNNTYVKFSEVYGMNEINDVEPCKITVVDKFNFKLDLNTSDFNYYIRNGVVENVKMPKVQRFTSLRESLLKPLLTSSG